MSFKGKGRQFLVENVIHEVFNCFKTKHRGFPSSRNGQPSCIRKVQSQLVFQMKELRDRFTKKGFIGVSFKIGMRHITNKGINPDP